MKAILNHHYCECCHSSDLVNSRKLVDHSLCRACGSFRYQGQLIKNYSEYYSEDYYNGELFQRTDGKFGFPSSYWENGGDAKCTRYDLMINVFRDCFVVEENLEWLDFGAGLGHFLSRAGNSFVLNKPVAYELNEGVKEIIYEKYGFATDPGNLRFDVISSIDTIEHCEDLKAYFEQINNFAKLNCKLIISTPNGGSLNFKYYTSNWNLFIPPEHVRYVTAKGLTNLLHYQGWQVVKLLTIGHLFHNSRSLNEDIFSKLTRKVGSISFINHLVNQLMRLGPILVVCAEKVA